MALPRLSLPAPVSVSLPGRSGSANATRMRSRPQTNGRAPPPSRESLAQVERGRGGRVRRLQPRALPLAEPPEVAPDLGRIELAAREVHVRSVDQAPLVTGQ